MIPTATPLRRPSTAAPAGRGPAEVISLEQRRSARTLATSLDKVIAALDQQLVAMHRFRQKTQDLDRGLARLEANWSRYQDELATVHRRAIELGGRSRRLAGYMTTCEARLSGAR